MDTTPQAEFWKGRFGSEYTARTQGGGIVEANRALFSRVLQQVDIVQLNSILELGANVGANLSALQQLSPAAKLAAVEINKIAAQQLKRNLPHVTLFEQSLLDFEPTKTWDLVFTKGVLIHIDPRMLSRAYDVLHKCASRYIVIAEYYNPVPVEVEYRGHAGKLFKRDFAGELLDRFTDLCLVDYGFAYHRDSLCPQDDLNWFLLERRK